LISILVCSTLFFNWAYVLTIKKRLDGHVITTKRFIVWSSHPGRTKLTRFQTARHRLNINARTCTVVCYISEKVSVNSRLASAL